jgi:hypothetical protein
VTAYSALSPVSAAVYGALNVAALTAIAPGGVHDDVAQSTGFPFVLYEVSETPRPAFGAGFQPRIDLTVHVYSQYAGMAEAQGVLAKVVELLSTPPAVVAFSSWAIFYDDAIEVGDELIAGVKCKELVGKFRIYVEAQ